MKTKTLIISVSVLILSYFTIPTFSQETKKDDKKSCMGMGQQGMMGMQKMGGMMDSCMTKCNMMMQRMKKMKAQMEKLLQEL